MSTNAAVGAVPVQRSGFRRFFIAWLGQIVSALGSSLTSFGLGVWLFQRSGSATQWALLLFFYSVATILTLPLAGALVDRWDRRNVMIVTDSGAALGVLLLAFLAWNGWLHAWHIYAVVTINSIFNAFQMPAFSATVPLLVSKEQLGRTAGLVQLGMALPGVAGPFLAGSLIGAAGLPGVLAVDLVSFAFGILTLLAVRFPKVPQSAESSAARGSLLREIAFGWAYLRARPGLLALLFTFAGVNFCLGLVQSVLPPMVLSFASATELGTVMSVAGIGMVVGSVVMSVWGGPRRRIRGIFLGLSFVAAVLFLAGFKPSLPLIATAAFLFMLCFPIISGCSAVIWQRKIAPDVLGRTASLQRMISTAALPFAAILSGPLAEYVFEPLLARGGPLAGSVGQVIGVGPGRGIALMFILLGLLTYTALFLGWSNPRLRHLEEEIPDAQQNEPRAAPAEAAG
jgi:MFS family permease